MAFADIPISTVEELQKIGNDPAYPLDGSYYLTNNIDASHTRNWNDGKGFDPILKMEGENYVGFSGSFEGNEYMIRKLNINRPEEELVGLFGYLSGADINNLKIMDTTIVGGKYTGGLSGYSDYNDELDKATNINNVHVISKEIHGNGTTGGLIGYSISYINNCSVRGNLTSTELAAGLIGFSLHAKIIKSNAIVKINSNNSFGFVGSSRTYIEECYSGGFITGENCGGLIGLNFSGESINCFSNCQINSIKHNGVSAGLVRENQLYVTNSYASGKISGKGLLRGLIAIESDFFEPYPPEVTDSFYDYQTTGQYDDNFDDYGIPKSTKDMMDPATFENWDFENVWWMVPGKTYPLLRPERYIDVSLKPAEWMPEPKYGFPLEYEIVFGEEMSDRFTFDDIDFTSSTLESPVGTLTTENGTTWTLMITDTASTPTWPADIVLRVPLAGATNLANYPCAESNATSITVFGPDIPGDLNGDGVCDEVDKIILVEMIIEPVSPWKTRIPFTRTDLNADNIIDVADVVAILPLMNKSQ